MILHIITSLGNGGAEALLYTLVRKDVSNKHVVISLHELEMYGPLLEDIGIQVFALNMPRGRLTGKGLLLLWRLTRKLKPEAIHCWMYHSNLVGGVVGRLAGQPHIIWALHNTAMGGEGVSRSTNFVNKLCAKLSRFIPLHIVHSSHSGAKEHIELGYEASKMSVIPGGYDLTKFAPNPAQRDVARKQLGISPDAIVIGMFARWHPQKDHENLIKAIATIDKEHLWNVQVALFGTEINEDNQALLELLRQHNLLDKFKLVGPVSDVAGYMSAVDMHVLSSAYGESFPNVVNEAMACEVPCIVTDVADCSVIVGDVGLVVPPKDPESLGKAILSYISEIPTDAWLRRKTSSRAHIQDNFSVASLITRYQNLWDTKAGS